MIESYNLLYYKELPPPPPIDLLSITGIMPVFSNNPPQLFFAASDVGVMYG
jgi:hypothetical protein